MSGGRWVVVVGLVLAGACSGDDGDEAGGSTTAVTTEAVDPADAVVCDAFGLLLVGPLAEGGLDPGDPAQLESAVVETQATVDLLRTGAPPDVADAAAEVADAYDAAFAVLATYGYDLDRVAAEATPDEQAVLDAFGRPPAGPDAVDPFDTLETFVADRCAPGVTVPPDLLTTTTARTGGG